MADSCPSCLPYPHTPTPTPPRILRTNDIPSTLLFFYFAPPPPPALPPSLSLHTRSALFLSTRSVPFSPFFFCNFPPNFPSYLRLTSHFNGKNNLNFLVDGTRSFTNQQTHKQTNAFCCNTHAHARTHTHTYTPQPFPSPSFTCDTSHPHPSPPLSQRPFEDRFPNAVRTHPHTHQPPKKKSFPTPTPPDSIGFVCLFRSAPIPSFKRTTGGGGERPTANSSSRCCKGVKGREAHDIVHLFLLFVCLLLSHRFCALFTHPTPPPLCTRTHTHTRSSPPLEKF